MVEGVRHFHTFLAGNEFEIVTDHVSLTYLNKIKLSTNNRLTRWALYMQGYKFKITYKKGSKMTAADALSRIPRPVTNQNVEVTADDDSSDDAPIFTVQNVAPQQRRVRLEFTRPDEVTEAIASVTQPALTATLPSLEAI